MPLLLGVAVAMGTVGLGGRGGAYCTSAVGEDGCSTVLVVELSSLCLGRNWAIKSSSLVLSAAMDTVLQLNRKWIKAVESKKHERKNERE
ncbi:hypothetical protein HN873_028589 [Arachis hypogaea]